MHIHIQHPHTFALPQRERWTRTFSAAVTSMLCILHPLVLALLAVATRRVPASLAAQSSSSSSSSWGVYPAAAAAEAAAGGDEAEARHRFPYPIIPVVCRHWGERCAWGLSPR